MQAPSTNAPASKANDEIIAALQERINMLEQEKRKAEKKTRSCTGK